MALTKVIGGMKCDYKVGARTNRAKSKGIQTKIKV